VLHALRDRVTISRRDIDKMIATGVYEGVPADWCAFSELSKVSTDVFREK